MKNVCISFELPEDEAEALAQFLKRAGFSEYRALSVNDEEAYNMRAAADKVQKALAEVGFNPR